MFFINIFLWLFWFFVTLTQINARKTLFLPESDHFSLKFSFWYYEHKAPSISANFDTSVLLHLPLCSLLNTLTRVTRYRNAFVRCLHRVLYVACLSGLLAGFVQITRLVIISAWTSLRTYNFRLFPHWSYRWEKEECLKGRATYSNWDHRRIWMYGHPVDIPWYTISLRFLSANCNFFRYMIITYYVYMLYIL